LTVNGAAAGRFGLPCDGGLTTVPAVVTMKLGWTATEVAAAATATLDLRLTDNDPLFPDPYAVETFTASSADVAVPAPPTPPFSATAAKWTEYTARFTVFCATYGCILCARDARGVVGSQGSSRETFKGFFVLTTATDSADGRTAGEVVVECGSSYTGITPLALAAPKAEALLASLTPATPAGADWVAVVDGIVERRIADALAQRFPHFLEVAADLVEPIDRPPLG
jgi:hypothetical protein